MRVVAIATAVLFVTTSANAAPITLVCNGTVSTIRGDVKAPAGIAIEDRMEGEQWTVTIDTATEKLTLYPLPGLPGLPGVFAGEGDIKSIAMQAHIDADKDADKGSPWEGLLPDDGSINRITGAFDVTVPLGSKPRDGLEYSGNCKQAQPLF